MRFITLLILGVASIGVMAQAAKRQDDSCTNIELASCVAAPLTSTCIDVDCACGILRSQTDCYKSLCHTVDPGVLADYESACPTDVGNTPANTVATTTAADSGSRATGTANGGNATPTPTKNAALMRAVPARGMIAVAVVAIVYL